LKILVAGLGSIGKRHLNNLLSLKYEDISVVTRSNLPAGLPSLCTYKSIAEAFKHNFFNTVFICTPTSHHIANLYEILQNKVENIYVEKPLSHDTNDIAQILSLAASYKNNIVVGYDLHFDPGIQKIRALLQQNIIGKIISVNAFVGQYLPDWRPYEDHRKGTSARKETGGGVLLDIVHEFDYLCWLTGNADEVACFYTNSGSLEIETEEAAEVLIKFSNGVIGTVHLDYLQRSLVRYCIFTGTHGTITCNIAKSNVNWITENGNTGEFNYTGFERNDRFKAIISTFLENSKDERLTSLQASVQSLQVVQAAKYSAANKCITKLTPLN